MSARIHPTADVHWTARLGHNVIVGPNVIVREDCVIQSGTVIGEDGFGYERPHPHARWVPRAHEHGVIIERDVHVGANTCIDAGSWRPTRINRGTRIDNLVHVAHNVEVGRDCMVVAHAMLAGSVTVKDGAWIAPGARIHQRLTIGEYALIGMGAVVLEDVPANQTWAGVPARCLDARQGVRDEM